MIVYGQNTPDSPVFAMDMMVKRHSLYAFMECNMLMNLCTRDLWRISLRNIRHSKNNSSPVNWMIGSSVGIVFYIYLAFI